MVDAKDTYAGQHSQSVSRLVEGIARAMALDEEVVDQMRLAGLLHDLGKIAIPDAILQKPGRLDPEELRTMREHSDLGYRLLEGLGVSPVDRWIRHHHEWWDGSGYPLGLAGEEIPLGSRIILVADAFDAMTSDRCYRAAGTPQAALDELRQRSWTQFDARVVGALETYLTVGYVPSRCRRDRTGRGCPGRPSGRGRLMVLLSGLAVALAIVLACGGRLGRLADLRIARDLAPLRRDRPPARGVPAATSAVEHRGRPPRSGSALRPTPAWSR